MKFLNSILIALFFFCLTLTLFLVALHYALSIEPTWANDGYTIALQASVFVGVFILLINGTLLQSMYFKVILALALAVMLPALPVLPNAWNAVLFPIGLLGIPTTYAIHFFRKKNKTALDAIKLMWVWFTFMGSLILVLHLPTGEEIGFVSNVYLVAMTLYFLFRFYWPSLRKNRAMVDNS